MTEQKLKECPFCGCEMYWFSNRDWHRIRGGHDDGCVFDWEQDALMVPATDEDKAEAANDWNHRTAPDTKEKYEELIMAVASKFGGESRHETALRYIRERENPDNRHYIASAEPKRGE